MSVVHARGAVGAVAALGVPDATDGAVDALGVAAVGGVTVSSAAARQMMKTLASTQRCRLSEIAEQTLERHTVEMTTRELAKRLFYTSDSSPP